MSTRYPLHKIILDDLSAHHKVALCLLLLVIASSVATIWITHQTRLLISEEGKLTELNQKLANQYVNLQLEENSLSQRSRVEGVAGRIGLQPIKKEQEIILVH